MAPAFANTAREMRLSPATSVTDGRIHISEPPMYLSEELDVRYIKTLNVSSYLCRILPSAKQRASVHECAWEGVCVFGERTA